MSNERRTKDAESGPKCPIGNGSIHIGIYIGIYVERGTERVPRVEDHCNCLDLFIFVFSWSRVLVVSILVWV